MRYRMLKGKGSKSVAIVIFSKNKSNTREEGSIVG